MLFSAPVEDGLKFQPIGIFIRPFRANLLGQNFSIAENVVLHRVKDCSTVFLSNVPELWGREAVL